MILIKKRLINLEKEGVDRKRIVIDPGFGFNKSIEQNIELHNDFTSEKFNNFPILIGTSKNPFLVKFQIIKTLIRVQKFL